MTRAPVAVVGLLLLGAVYSAAAEASCVALTAAEQRARAQVIVDAVALSGPTPSGIQQFHVTGYRKGRGPELVRVNTGNVRRADGSSTTTSVSVVVKRGERWRIFAQGSPRNVLRTTICDGTRKIRTGPLLLG